MFGSPEDAASHKLIHSKLAWEHLLPCDHIFVNTSPFAPPPIEKQTFQRGALIETHCPAQAHLKTGSMDLSDP